jgi:activator of HSP90 ATPase
MATRFEIGQQFSVSAKQLYEAWLDSETHSDMTGGEAVCSSEVGATFTAWDGYISGSNVSLNTEKEIVQKWRTSEFDASDDDSLLTLKFEDNQNGCMLSLIHEQIPDGQPDYKQGWEDHYFSPMRNYFG